MAKKNNGNTANTCGVNCVDGKYYCVDCGHEVKADHDCPQCKRQVDWERAIVELRRPAP
mgnify:CR=1 FL=1